jgi:ubiquinone/menaquinone biosynthesis C-methylase UbiE
MAAFGKQAAVSRITFDQVAPAFDRHRVLPDGVSESVRSCILAACTASARPEILDLGAGTGRLGRAFVAAGDAYVGLDLSLPMLHRFDDPRARLIVADGERLPFRDRTFDIVLLLQVLGGAPGWRGIVDESRRVLRPAGVLAVGWAATPERGLDDQMKTKLATLLGKIGAERHQGRKSREQALSVLRSTAKRSDRVIAASWTAQRSARAFLERQPSGTRFATLPRSVRSAALGELADWAQSRFGPLDTAFSEEHAFELGLFQF